MDRAVQKSALAAIFSLLAACMLCAAATLGAQSQDSTVSGQITGLAGEPVDSAKITAVHSRSGARLETIASASGKFAFAHLTPGPWQFRVVAGGYLTPPPAILYLVAGVAQTLDLKLDRDPSMASGGEGGSWILSELPAGMLDFDNVGQRPIRFSSLVAGSIALVEDGVEMTPLITRSQWGLSHFLLTPSSYQQVRVTAAQFTADSNLTPGGERSIISRAGVNSWHGQIFGFPRNDLLSANAGFSSGNLKLESTEYGGALTGPLRRDWSHFYAVYAGLRQTVGETLTGYVPTPAFAAQVAAAQPALAPLLAAFPAGTEPLAGSTDSMTYLGTGNQIDNEDALSMRIDDNLPGQAGRGQRDALFFHISLDSASTNVPVSQAGTYLNDLLLLKAHPLSGVLGWSHRFGPMLNQNARLSYVRGTYESAYQGRIGLPYSLEVSGLTTLTGDESTYGASNSYAASDSLAWTHGRHSVLAGGELRQQQLNQRNSDSGAIIFSSFTDLEENRISVASYDQALPANGLKEWQIYAWLQDNWRVRSNLVAGMGIRYEFFNRLHEMHGKAIPFDFTTCGSQGFCQAGASFGRINPWDLDPRLSLAWAPQAAPSWMRSRTVLRAGGGIYHANGQLSDQSQPIYNEVQNFYLSSAQQAGLSYPIVPFLANAKGIESALSMDRERKDPYAAEWGASVQSLTPWNTVLTASYFGAQGTHLEANTYVNLIDPETRERPFPTFGQIAYRQNTGSSSLNAVAFLAQHDLRSGLQLSAGFNWSHEIDDGVAGDAAADPPENPACPRCNRASGDADARHLAGLYSLYQIPLGSVRAHRAQSQFVNRIAGNWDLLNQFTARSALPVNVTVDRSAADVGTGYTIGQRPDRVPGISLRPPGGPSVLDWINPAAFTAVQGLYGDAGRNVARGPAAWQLDTGLLREFPLPRELRLSARAYMQNILNRAQYGQPLADWSTRQFGEIVSPANTNRLGSGGIRALFASFSMSF